MGFIAVRCTAVWVGNTLSLLDVVLAQGNQGACSEQGRCFLSEGLCEIPTTANPAGEQPLGAGLLQDPLGIPRLLSEVLRTRTRGAGHNLEHRRLLLNTRKHICAMQVTEPWHRLCREVGEFSPWRPSKLSFSSSQDFGTPWGGSSMYK